MPEGGGGAAAAARLPVAGRAEVGGGGGAAVDGAACGFNDGPRTPPGSSAGDGDTGSIALGRGALLVGRSWRCRETAVGGGSGPVDGPLLGVGWWTAIAGALACGFAAAVDGVAVAAARDADGSLPFFRSSSATNRNCVKQAHEWEQAIS